VFRAYRHELASVAGTQSAAAHDDGFRTPQMNVTDAERSAKLAELFHNAGLKTARQRYSYTSQGQTYSGENVYAVLHAPRGDGTEAIVLVAPLRNIDGVLNVNGVPLLISLARYFKRWSLWSKDIIFLVTPDSTAGPQAWVDAYHSTHDPEHVQDLSLKSGALQGAVCIDYPFEHRFETFHIAYDGINGQLPNLDLFNTAVSIASGQMGIGTSIQFQHRYAQYDTQHSYRNRLRTLVRGMSSQALGHATGPHSVFMTYHIDAITLSAISDGWQDEMAFGRTIESICRSLNNLLEKLHQSFFFYLLIQSNRFVSIGSYLPSAMSVAAAYTVMAIYLWVMSGYQQVENKDGNGRIRTNGTPSGEGKNEASEKVQHPETATTPDPVAKVRFQPVDRQLALPITFVTSIHLISLIPLYLLTTLSPRSLPQISLVFAMFSLLSPIILASALTEMPNNTTLPAFASPTHQQYALIKALSLLVLGLFLTVLATLNFSLSMFLGISCTPLAFVDRIPGSRGLAAFEYAVLVIMSPVGAAVALGGYEYFITGQEDALIEWLSRLAFAWNIWGSWGVIGGVLCVWWPAWITASTLVASSWFVHDGHENTADEIAVSSTISKDEAKSG